MAEEVISGGGQIAQEETLKALLAAVAGSGDSAAVIKVKQLAQASGQTSETLKKTDEELQQVNAGLLEFTEKLLDGTASTSDLARVFTGFKGTVGLVAVAFTKLLEIQEANFKTYQKVTDVGVNFSGSLTDMRLAAMKSYLTLDQFATVVKNNSQTLAKMGVSVNDGAKVFSQINQSLISSDHGKQLQALGYSTDEISDSMLKYIEVSGGRSASELKNTKEIAEASGQYLEELDKLTQFTGASRKQMEEEQKKAAANAAYQRALANMSEKEKAKIEAGRSAAAASGIAGAQEAYMSRIAGLPPMTKEAQQFAGTLPRAYEGLMKTADAAKNVNTGMSDVTKGTSQFYKGVQNDVKGLGTAGDALAFSGNQVVNGASLFATTLDKKGGDFETAANEITENQKKQYESQANNMAEANAGFKELGTQLMGLISPLLSFVSVVAMVVGKVASALGTVIGWFNKLFEPLGTFGTIIKGAIVALGAYLVLKRSENVAMMASRAGGAVSGAVSGVAGKVGGALGGIGGGAGGAAGGAAGGGFVSFITSLGRGLASLAPIAVPMIIGAGAVAAVIALLGAGVAAAIALIGVGLPVFAKGIKSITEIDGLNLMKVAGALALLGPAMLLFSGSMVAAGLMTAGSKILNFFTGGGPVDQVKTMTAELAPYLPTMEKIGPALNNYAQGLVAFGKAVSSVDIAKAERLKEVMKGPGVLEGIGSAIKDVGSATAKLATSNAGGQEKSGIELTALNSSVKELIKVSREISDYTKRTMEATKKINGDHFA